MQDKEFLQVETQGDRVRDMAVACAVALGGAAAFLIGLPALANSSSPTGADFLQNIFEIGRMIVLPAMVAGAAIGAAMGLTPPSKKYIQEQKAKGIIVR
jgi:hypothetical protein